MNATNALCLLVTLLVVLVRCARADNFRLAIIVLRATLPAC